MAKIVVVTEGVRERRVYLNAEQVVAVQWHPEDKFLVLTSGDAGYTVNRADATAVLKAMGYDGEVVA